MRSKLRRIFCWGTILLAFPACHEGVVSPQHGDESAGGDPVATNGTPVTNEQFKGKACGGEAFRITREIPDVLIVLDRSTSMSNPAEGGPPLWPTVTSAVSSLVSALDSQIGFGLFAFPSAQTGNACNAAQAAMNSWCAVPSGPEVQVAPGTSSAIKASLSSLGTCGNTPTRAVLEEAKRYLAQVPTNHDKYILLATDGAPNCGEQFDPQTCTCSSIPVYCTGGTSPSGTQLRADPLLCLDDTATHQTLDSLCQSGVKTYVIGMGASLGIPNLLQGLAQHGCTNQPYAATDPTSLQQAFEEIAGIVSSCVFHLDCAKIEDPNLVNLIFDGQIVAQSTDQTSGWDWTQRCQGQNGTGTVQFFGAQCKQILDGSVKAVAARYGCQTLAN